MAKVFRDSTEEWILIALTNATDKNGLYLEGLFLSKHSEKLKANLTQFINKIKEMEEKGLIKKSQEFLSNHCLTKEGRKKLLKVRNLRGYYDIISEFPEIELRERIENIESFLLAGLLTTILFFIGKIPFIITQDNFPTAIALISVYTTLFLFAAVQTYIYLFKIFLFWTFSLKRNTLWVYREWLWNNRNKIIYPIPIVIVIAILYFIYIYNIFPWQAIVGTLALSVVTAIITNLKKVVGIIKRLFGIKE